MEVLREDWKLSPEPAFAMMVSMCVIPCLVRSWIMAVAPVSVVLERVAMISLLPAAMGSFSSSVVEVVDDRTVAMTVVFSLVRREAVRPKPMHKRDVSMHGKGVNAYQGKNLDLLL